MKKQTAASLLILICVVLGIFLLTKVIKVFVSGIVFAVGLVTLGQQSPDVHCECTRATHQAVFETALGRPFRVEIVESLRRGGKTCHFIVHLD